MNLFYKPNHPQPNPYIPKDEDVRAPLLPRSCKAGKGFRIITRYFHLCWACGYSWISKTQQPVLCAYKPCSSNTWFMPRSKLDNNRLFRLVSEGHTEKRKSNKQKKSKKLKR